MANKTLIVRLYGDVAGNLIQDDVGRLSFRYSSEWLERPTVRPLSLSLPLRAKPFDDRSTRPFFSGLLPDDLARERLARFLNVSHGNVFGLLRQVGGECAGAVTIHLPGTDRPTPRHEGEEDLLALDERALASFLRDLPRRPLLAGGELRLSLAGAQDKMAVVRTKAGLCLPRDDRPTTHIIKPAIPQFAETVLNEQFCLALAARFGLRVPSTEIGSAEGISYLIVERYDRELDQEGRVLRVHQEDFCQALGILPERKYQSEGGPSLEQSFEVLDACVRPVVDRLELLRRVIFNYLVGNADSHGKNFALLHSADGTRLAPVYDVLCTTVYDDLSDRMAMKIGGKRRFSEVFPRHWERFARAAGLASPRVRTDLLAATETLPALAQSLAEELRTKTTDSGKLLEDIVVDIENRASHLRRLFGVP